MDATRPPSYGELSDLFDRAKELNLMPDVKTLSEFAQITNELVGEPFAQAAVNDNIVKQASHAVDKFLRPVSQPIGRASQWTAEQLGLGKYGKTAYELGEGLPRMLAEALGVGVAATSIAGSAPVSIPALIAGGAGLAGAGAATYTETDSPLAGAVSAGMFAAMPPMMSKAGQLAVSPIKKRFFEEVAEQAGKKTVTSFRPVAQAPTWIRPAANVVERAGRQAGAVINMELATQATSLAAGGGLVPFNEEHVAGLVGGVAPFALLDMLHVLPRPAFDAGGGLKMRTPESPLEQRALASTKRAAAEIIDYNKQQMAKVEDLVDVIQEGKADIKSATEVRLVQVMRKHVFDRMEAARRANQDVVAGLFTDVIEGRPVKLSVEAERLVNMILADYEKRGILEKLPSGEYKQIRDIDLDGSIINEMQQQELGLTSPKMALPKGRYVIGAKGLEPGTYGAEMEPSEPRPTPSPYLPLPTVQEIPQVPVGPFLIPALRFPIPEEPSGVRPIKLPTRAEQPREKKTPRVYTSEEEAYRAGAGEEAEVAEGEGEKPFRKERTEQRLFIRSGEPLPEPMQGPSLERRKLVPYPEAEEPGVPIPAEPTVRGTEVVPPATGETAASSVASFLQMLRAHFGKGTEQYQLVTRPTVPATKTEMNTRAQQLYSVMHDMVVKALTPGMTKRQREILELAGPVETKLAAGPKAELEARLSGAHKQMYALLRSMNERYNDSILRIAEDLEVLPAEEVVNRKLRVELERLKEMSRIQDEVLRPFADSVGEKIANELAAEKVLLDKKVIKKSRYQRVFERLQELSTGKVPWGKAVVRAMANLVADMDFRGKQLRDVKIMMPGAGTRVGGFDELNQYAVFMLYERAASLLSPEKWAEAKANRKYRGTTMTPEMEADARAALAKEAEGDVDPADVQTALAYIRSPILRQTPGEEGGTIAGLLDEGVKSTAIGYDENALNQLLQQEGSMYEGSIGLARRVPPGSPLEGMLTKLTQVFKGGAKLTREEWAKMDKAFVVAREDGTIDLEKSHGIGSISRVSESLATRLNDAFNAIVSGKYGKFFPQASGGFGFKLEVPEGMTYTEAEMRLVKEVYKPENLAEVEAMKPDINEVVREFENKKRVAKGEKELTEAEFEAAEPTLGVEKEARAEYKKRLKAWSDKVHQLYRNWSNWIVPALSERLQGPLLAEAKAAKVPKMTLPIRELGSKAYLERDEGFTAQLTSALEGINKVVDVFSGSTALARLTRQLGWSGELVENVGSKRIADALNLLKQNPDLPKEVAVAVEQLRPIIRDQTSVREYLSTLRPEIVTLLKKNLSHMYTGYTYTESLLNKFGESLVDALRLLRTELGRIQSEDGWSVLARTKKGDLAFVDPPYAEARGYASDFSKEKAVVTTQERIKQLEQILKPALKRGVKVFYWDSPIPEIERYLRSLGMNTELVKSAKERVELRANNVERPSPKMAAVEPEKAATGVRTGTDAATTAMRAVDTGTADPQQLVRDTHSFFAETWRDMGLDPGTATLYTKLAMKVAAAFPELGLGRLARETVDIGGYYGLGYRRFIVGLNPEVIAKYAPRDRANFILSTLAHELTHATFWDQTNWPSFPSWKQELIGNVIKQADNLGPTVRAFTLYDWMRIAEPTSREFQEHLVARTYEAANTHEYLADLGSFIVKGMINPDFTTLENVRRVGEAALYSDSHVQQFMNGFFVPIVEVGEALAKFVEQRGGVKNKAISDEVMNVIRGVRDVLASTNEAVKASIDAFTKLESFDPLHYDRTMAEGWLSQSFGFRDLQQRLGVGNSNFGISPKVAAHAVEKLNDAVDNLGLGNRTDITRLFGVRPNFFEGNFMLPSFLAQRFPILRPVIDIGMRWRGMANDAANKILDPFMTSTPFLGALYGRRKIDPEVSGLRYVMTHDAANDAASAIGLWQNEVKRSLTREEMVGLCKAAGLNDPAGQQKVIDFETNKRASMLLLHETNVNLLKRVVQSEVSNLIAHDHPATRFESNKAVGGVITDNVWKILTSKDPNEILVANSAIDALRPVYQHLDKAVAVAQERLSKVKNYMDDHANQEWFMSEQRHGRYRAIWLDNVAKKHGMVAKDDQRAFVEQVDKLKERQARGEIKNLVFVDKYDRQQQFAGLHKDYIKVIQDIENPAMKRATVALGYTFEQAQQLRSEYVPLEATLRQVGEGTLQRLMYERELAPGRETIDVPQGFLLHVQGVTNSLAREVAQGDFRLVMRDPVWKGQDAMANLAKAYYSQVMNPSAKEFSFLKRLIFSTYMGFNFSSMLVESTQPFLMTLPLITRDTGSVSAGYKYFGDTIKMIVKRATSKERTFGDAEVDWAVKEAQSKGVMDFGISQEFQDETAIAHMNLRSLAQGRNATLNPLKWSKSLLDMYAKVGRNVYSLAPRLNSAVSFITLFEAARKHGVMQGGKLVKLDKYQAFAYAESTIKSATLGGGLANRPLLFGKLGKAQGVVGLMYSLGTYSMGMISHLARLGLDSIDKRFTGAERVAARKALGQTLATQAALAGAMGLPMATAAIAVLEQLFPTLEVKKVVTDTVQKMVDEDEEGGGIWTDFVLRGAPFAFGGVDLSSRLEVSNLLGLSPYDGFSLQNLMGPSGSILENIVRAARKGVEGRPAGEVAETVLPTAWKNVVRLYRDNWEMRDPNGQLLLKPTETELALDVIGFRPSRLQKVRDAQKMARRGDEATTRENDAFHDKLADEFIAGGADVVQQKLIERQVERPGYIAVAGARSVIERVLDKTLPFDFAREGARMNAAERQRLARTAGVQQIGEVDRLMTQKALETQIGLPGLGALSNTELTLAQIVDQLRAQNPLLSVQEARAIAVQLLGQQPQQLGMPQSGPAGPANFDQGSSGRGLRQLFQ